MIKFNSERVWISVASYYGQKAWRRYRLANRLMYWSTFRPISKFARKKAYELYDEADEYFDLASLAIKDFIKSED